MKNRVRSWYNYLATHWSYIPWANGHPLPSRDTLRHWSIKVAGGQLSHGRERGGLRLSPSPRTPLPQLELSETSAADINLAGAAEIVGDTNNLLCEPLQVPVRRLTFSSPSSSVQRAIETDILPGDVACLPDLGAAASTLPEQMSLPSAADRGNLSSSMVGMMPIISSHHLPGPPLNDIGCWSRYFVA